MGEVDNITIARTGISAQASAQGGVAGRKAVTLKLRQYRTNYFKNIKLSNFAGAPRGAIKSAL